MQLEITTKPKIHQPFILKALVFVILVFGLLSWLRFEQALANWSLYLEVSSQPLPLYLAVSGAVWGMTAIALVIGLWLRKIWAIWLTGIGVALFSVWFWLERIVLSQNEAARSNWLFNAIFFVVILLFIYTTLLAVYPYNQETLRLKK